MTLCRPYLPLQTREKPQLAGSRAHGGWQTALRLGVDSHMDATGLNLLNQGLFLPACFLEESSAGIQVAGIQCLSHATVTHQDEVTRRRAPSWAHTASLKAEAQPGLLLRFAAGLHYRGQLAGSAGCPASFSASSSLARCFWVVAVLLKFCQKSKRQQTAGVPSQPVPANTQCLRYVEQGPARGNRDPDFINVAFGLACWKLMHAALTALTPSPVSELHPPVQKKSSFGHDW